MMRTILFCISIQLFLRLVVVAQSSYVPQTKAGSEVKRTIGTVQLSNVTSSALKFEVSTNRGSHSLVFKEGDTIRFAVRVSKPCMVRLIYRQMDNKLVLLRNRDFQVNAYEVDEWVEIPEEFLCTAPFGTEFLIAYASTEPFEALNTHEEGGNVIIENTLADTKKISLSRGISNNGVPVIEQVLQLTTKASK